MKGFRDDSQISVNLVSQVIPRESRELGIRGENEIHEALKDAISFNGERYDVSLPWKEGHGPSTNQLPEQFEMLEGADWKVVTDDPDVLRAYDAVITEQAALGIVERVPELEALERIHYLSHHAVIRENAKTTKVRVVYDASSKEGKRGLSLSLPLRHASHPWRPYFYLRRPCRQKSCLAGTPFMVSNDIAVRPAKRQVILGDGTIHNYGS